MGKIADVCAEAIETIRPNEQERERFEQKVGDFLEELNHDLKDGEAVLGGSGAKDTWISGAHDADIFVRFALTKYAGKDAEMSSIIEKALKKRKALRVHGSRDYFQIKEDGFLFEVVPILDINDVEQAVNITDISPKHAEWVVANVADKDEIRLLKAFTRTAGVYGAESYIHGFSGYVLEILVAHYGSFEATVREAAKWKDRTIIDIEQHHKKVLFELNQSKLVSPLVVIDPVQKGRNTAAALSKENYETFVSACKDFLKKPTVAHFSMKKPTIEEIVGDSAAVLLDVENLEGSEDVVGCKLVKVVSFLKEQCADYPIQKAGFLWTDSGATIYLVHDGKALDEQKEFVGPETEREEHAKNFRKRHKDVYERDGRLYAKEKRKFTVLAEEVASLLKESYVKERVKNISMK